MPRPPRTDEAGRLYHALNREAALFGETRMLWTTGPPRQIGVPLSDVGPCVIVDVVGRVRDLPAGEENVARLEIAGSPMYVLKRSDYDRLTAFD